MVGLAALFLVIALMAGLTGFSVVAGDLASSSWLVFLVFLVLFVLSAAASLLNGRRASAP